MKWLILAAIIFLHGFILTRLIFFPYPEFFIYPYLTNQGLLPYKQIFDQHFPGLMFLPINLNNLGMVNEIVARWWLISLIVLTQILLFLVGSRVFQSAKKALLINVLYLIWQPFLEGWVLWIESFLPLFYLPAFYFIYEFISQKRDSRMLVAAGFFLGLGVLFKQSTLPLAAFVGLLIFYYTPNIKTVTLYLAGLLPVPILMVLYFWKLGVIENFWYWTVIFNLTTFAKYGNKPPIFSGLVRILGIYSPALLLPMIKDKKLVAALLIFILGGLSGDIVRFDFIHFQSSLPFIVITTAALAFKVWEFRIMKVAALGYLVVVVIWLSVFYRGHLGNKVFFFDEQTLEIANKIKQNTNPKEEIFLFGPVPHLYQITETIPAGKIFVFQFPWFIMETEDKFLLALSSTPPNLIVRDRTVEIEGQPIVEFAARLDKYIEDNYDVFDRVGQTEFLRRNAIYASRL